MRSDSEVVRMVDRMARVIRLDHTIYAEVEGDEAGISVAARMVACVALAITIGTGLQIAISDLPRAANPAGAVAGSLGAPFIHWIIWSTLIYTVGVSAFGGGASYATALSMIGLSMAPQALGIFSFVPVVGPALALLGQLLTLRAGSLAVQSAHHVDSRRTIFIIAITFLAALVISTAARAFLTQIGFWDVYVVPFRR